MMAYSLMRRREYVSADEFLKLDALMAIEDRQFQEKRIDPIGIAVPVI